MTNRRSTGLFVAFTSMNYPRVTKMRPVIHSRLSRQKVGFYFLTNVE